VETQLNVDFESLEPSSALVEAIRSEVRALERRVPRLIGCNVVVREPHRHQRSGRQFEVRIHLTLPGGEIAVTRGAGGRRREDPHLAVRDAFAQLRTQVRRFTSVRRAEVKRREPRVRSAA
jgi:ribosome-associated translation inhibitor RaiA